LSSNLVNLKIPNPFIICSVYVLRRIYGILLVCRSLDLTTCYATLYNIALLVNPVDHQQKPGISWQHYVTLNTPFAISISKANKFYTYKLGRVGSTKVINAISLYFIKCFMQRKLSSFLALTANYVKILLALQYGTMHFINAQN
jgi:hypothetical protein